LKWLAPQIFTEHPTGSSTDHLPSDHLNTAEILFVGKSYRSKYFESLAFCQAM